MRDSTNQEFGQSSNGPFRFPPDFGQNNNQHNDPFAAKPFGTQASSPAFGATSIPAFGASSRTAFGASSSSVDGSSVFGQKHTSSVFGSTTESSSVGSPFQPTSTRSSLSFGSTPAFGQSTSIGSSPFGPTSSSSCFGSSPAFGQSTSAPGSSPFGASSSSSCFGSSPAFGQSTSASGCSPFGTTSSASCFGSSPAFGQSTYACGSSPFGTISSSFSFRPSPAFGQSTSAFGTSPIGAASSSFSFGSSPAFGQSTSEHRSSQFGATSSSSSFGSSPAFGQSTTASGSSPFNATSSSFGFGSSPAFGQSTSAVGSSPFGHQSVGGPQHRGTRVTPYAQTPEANSGSYTQPAGKLESISAMIAYKDKSHEELKWQDYQVGDKGGPNPAAHSSGGIGFNMNNTQQPNFWANTCFSTASTNPFAPKTSTLSTPAFMSSTSSLGSSPFCVAASNPIWSTSSPAPSTIWSTPANTFSSTTSTNPFVQTTSTSGSPCGYCCSLAATNSFKSTPPPPAFGSAPAFGFPTSGSLFSKPNSSAFGTSTSIFSTQHQGPTSSFDTTGLQSTTPTFGWAAPSFGQAAPSFGQAAPSFGQAAPSFGQAAPSFGQSTPAFGQSNGFGGNLFSNTPPLLSTNSMEFNQTTPSLTNPFNPPQPTQNTGGFGVAAPSGGTSSIFAQNNIAQPFASQGPFANQFGTLPAMPQMPLGRLVDKRGPMRISCRLTSRHLPQWHDYYPKIAGLKVEEETTSTTPAFGSHGFGQPSFGGQQHGGTRVTPYAQTPVAEGYSASQFAEKMEVKSISAMPAYKEKSHEELKWEDYQLGDEGGLMLLLNLLVDWSIA